MVFEFMNGGLSYDPAAVVANTSQNLGLVLGACIVSFVGAYMQYFGAIQMGFKHRTHSIPLVGNLWFFSHDTTYVMNFHHWFHEVDFWLVRAFWFALVVFATCECVVTYQILRFSRRDLFPGMSLPQSLASYIGLQLFTYGLFWWFMSMIEDPYYLLSFSTTVVLAPMFNIAMMRARGSRKGFSPFLLTGFVLLTTGFWAWMFLSDPYFLQPFYWLVATGNIGISVAALFYFRTLPEYRPPVTA
ncbi:hypothetical protein [Hydrocarboniphaga sp.]|uniref:hypothetical protein n=1 Tax=Hydrocarboniphaga sp. TaxID=2033016 RepID=UPI003D10D336